MQSMVQSQGTSQLPGLFPSSQRRYDAPHPPPPRTLPESPRGLRGGVIRRILHRDGASRVSQGGRGSIAPLLRRLRRLTECVERKCAGTRTPPCVKLMNSVTQFSDAVAGPPTEMSGSTALIAVAVAL